MSAEGYCRGVVKVDDEKLVLPKAEGVVAGIDKVRVDNASGVPKDAKGGRDVFSGVWHWRAAMKRLIR